MATVVMHKETGKHYILIGVSYSYFKDSRPGILGGNLFPYEEEGEFDVVAVCGDKGKIEWIQTKELSVIEVDNEKPNDILKRFICEDRSRCGTDSNSNDNEMCPGCGQSITGRDKECSSCGLTLILDDKEE